MKYRWNRAVWLALVTLTASAATASAQEATRPRLTFAGFGTVGLVHSGEDRSDFAKNRTRSSGPGHSGAFAAGVDSRIAGQATLSWGPRLTAVLQIMGEQNVDGEYRPRAEWANVSYAFTPELRLRGGRIALPAFMVSDSRKVSYANPWMRPPVEVYGMAPIYSLDGVDATFRTRVGDWTNTLNAAFGRAETDVPSGNVDAERTWNVNTTLARGALSGRLALGGGTLRTAMLSPLFDAFRAFSPEGVAIANRYDVDDRDFRFAAVGFELDPGAWFTIAELAWIDHRSPLGEKAAGYVTTGFRWRAVTMHTTYSRIGLLSESVVAGLTLTGLPPEHADVAAQLNDRLNALVSSAPVQQNLAVGIRWDFMANVALKAQLDFVDVLGASYGTFINMQPGLAPGGHVQLFSIATAFVF